MVALCGVVSFVIVAACAITVLKARRRIDDLLARTNPCEIELLPPGDLRFATTAQESGVAARRSACSRQREETRLAEERTRAEKQRREKEEEDRRERAAMCKALGERLDKPGTEPLPARTLTLLGKDADFFSRLVQGKFQGADVTRDVSALTCGDGPASDAIARTFAGAVVRNATTWLDEHALSPSVLAMATKGKEGAQLFQREGLQRPIDKLALKSLVHSEPEQQARARRACELLRALDVSQGIYCDALGPGRTK